LFHIAFVSIQYYKKHNIVDCLFIDCLFIACLIIAEEKADYKEGYRWVEVKTEGTGEAEWYMINKKATIDELRAMICDREDILPDKQRLIFAGKPLHIDTIIESLQIDDPDTIRIHLILELTGGGIRYSLIWKPFEPTEHNRGQYPYIYIYIYVYNVLANMFDENDVHL